MKTDIAQALVRDMALAFMPFGTEKEHRFALHISIGQAF